MGSGRPTYGLWGYQGPEGTSSFPIKLPHSYVQQQIYSYCILKSSAKLKTGHVCVLQKTLVYLFIFIHIFSSKMSFKNIKR